MLEDHEHGGAALADGRAEVAAGHRGQEVEILDEPRPVEPELPLHRGHLLARGGLVHEERGGIAGEAHEEEDDGHDAPHHDDGVEEAPQEELPHRLRYFRKPTGRKSMCSSDSAWKPTTRGLSA